MLIVTKKNIPNLLSMGRLLSVPLIIFLLTMGMGFWAFVVMAVFAISDLLDGYLARLWAVTSDFGAALDPIADKFFIASLSVVFVFKGLVPAWLVILILGRDLLILTGMGALTLKNRFPKIMPTFLSKLNTAAQLGYFGVVMSVFSFPALKEHAYLSPFSGMSWAEKTSLEQLLIPLVAFLTVASGLKYMAQGYRALCEKS
ncbi:CDP-alcohol phosphatidyltransferase family protein [Alphaproteobacteria bacterium]|nr:CDP-alcohol phosphatidyltransferase family protein [Alphaproteobacteria bacterium]